MMAKDNETVYLLQKPKSLKDDYGLVWWCFCFLGIGALLPWNTFLAPFNYYQHLYPNSPFYFIMSAAYNCTGLLSLILSIRFGSMFSFGTRIVPVLIVEILVLASIPIIAIYVPAKISEWLIIGLVFIIGQFSHYYAKVYRHLRDVF